MGFFSDSKPYTAVTSTIERLTGNDYDLDDVAEIVELLEIIHIERTGPTEAARAIRKKLKYGSVHAQLRALTILESLVQNGGKSLVALYNDEFLLERLRLLTTDPSTDSRVKKRTQLLFYGWSLELKDQRGYEKLAKLYQQMPQRIRRVRTEGSGGDSSARPKRTQPKYLSNDPDDLESDEEEDDSGSGRNSRGRDDDYDDYDDRDDNGYAGSSSARVRGGHSAAAPVSTKSSRKPKQSKSESQQPVILSIAKERPKIKEALAESGSAATNLTNALKLINRDEELSTENKRATLCFNQCRSLRRRVLRYIHSLDSEEYIGPLIHANEELVAALQLYDEMSHAPSDSDSDYDDWKVDSRDNQQHHQRGGEHDYHSQRSSGSSTPVSTTAHYSLSSPLDSPGRRRAPPPPPAKPANLRNKPVSFPSSTRVEQKVEDEDDADPFGDSHVADSAPKHTPMW